MAYTTEAWVLDDSADSPIVIKEISFPNLNPLEVLVRPVYGCFEGNMLHAIKRNPINVCRARGEKQVILGNAGVVKVQLLGSKVSGINVDQYCIFFCNGDPDEYGFPKKIAGYDFSGSMGLFAKILKVHYKQLIPIPNNKSISLKQWAAFSLRYITAWSNWKVAFSCFRSQMPSLKEGDINVVAWGGGVALAELSLAHLYGCKTFMTTSQESRLELIRSVGIHPINRSLFNNQNFETEFIRYLDEVTHGRRASIFIDNIGGKLFNVTLKSLARQGVLSTSGWKDGAVLPFVRSIECINRHIFVHTHYAKYDEGLQAVEFAAQNNWVPRLDDIEYDWYQLPQLINDYESGKLVTYFPIFVVNSNF